MRRLAVVLVLSLASPLLGQGQERVLMPGDRVRVTATSISRDPLVGTFVGLQDPQTMLYATEGIEEPREIAVSDVETLELSVGERDRAITGMWIGAGVGLAAVAVTAAADEAFREGLQGGAWQPAAVIVGVGFITLGGVLGYGIGQLIKTDIWEPVKLPAKPMVAVRPSGRFSVGVSIPVGR